MTTAPRRVTVTRPRTRKSLADARYPVIGAIDRQTELGQVYLRSLMRSQLRLGLLTCLSVCGALLLLPVLFLLLPWLSATIAWVVLGVLVYPVLIAVGAGYVRRAEHNEHQFAELVRRR